VNRMLSVIRMQLVAWPSTIGLLWAILGSSFAVNLVIFAAIGDRNPDHNTTGGLGSIYVASMITSAIALSQFFPFSMGLSVTRRMFYAATSALQVAQAVVFGVLLYVLKLIEDATGGWGVSVRFFGVPWLAQANGLLQILVYAVPFVVLGFIGMFCGVVFKRWGSNGVFTLVIAFALIVAGLVALATWLRAWPSVGHWLVNQSAVSLLTGWPLLLAVALAGAGYLAIRRATP
jgi:hypothetical protein